MKEYTIIYKDNTTREVEAPGKADLIRQYFDNNEDRFKAEVCILRWSDITMQYTLEVQRDKVSTELFSADVNPYGWRDHEGG